MAKNRNHVPYLNTDKKSDQKKWRQQDARPVFLACTTQSPLVPKMTEVGYCLSQTLYGFDLSEADVATLVTLCETRWNNHERCRKSGEGENRYRIIGEYLGKTIRPVFYPPTRTIITFLRF